MCSFRQMLPFKTEGHGPFLKSKKIDKALAAAPSQNERPPGAANLQQRPRLSVPGCNTQNSATQQPPCPTLRNIKGCDTT